MVLAVAKRPSALLVLATLVALACNSAAFVPSVLGARALRLSFASAPQQRRSGSDDYLNSLGDAAKADTGAAATPSAADDGPTPAAPADVDAAATAPATGGDTESSRAVKDLLLRRCLGTNRGFTSRSEERRQIGELIKELEAMNPNPSPNDGFTDGTSPLTGDWQLLFTNAPDVLSLALLPAVTIGQIYQNIGYDGTEIYNIVELQPLLAPIVPSTVARLEVTARGSVASSVRLNLAFEASAFKPLTLLGREVDGVLPPLKYTFPNGLRNVGWLEHSFVDEEMRVARAFGSVFVLLRC